MSSTLLEQTRALHEDLEVFEKAMYKELGNPSLTKMRRADEIARDQVVATLLDAHSQRAAQLATLYEDADGARREELASMSGDGVFTTFYDQLKELREYHRKFPAEPSVETAESMVLAEVLDSAPDEGFTGEEAEGRYVDMHALHDAFLNLKGVERVDYCTYLKKCATLSEVVPRSAALTNSYKQYAKRLHEYFSSFLKRTQPLVPLSKLLEAAESDFDQRWTRNEVTRWQQPQADANGGGSSGNAAPAAPIDLSGYTSASELEVLGMEILKAQLMLKGLKAGGSLTQKAERLFLLKSTPLEMIPKKHLGAPPAAAASNGNSSSNGGGGGGGGGSSDGARSMGLLEEQISRLGELLMETLEDTAVMIEKKQARTYEELERDLQAAEEEDAVMEEEEEEEEEDKPIYNPLNLPLGWDGKPIPYWLYKLHGLNLEFKCEICGNYSYWGPRPFERHFQEWRHSYGMKCLGIPNTKPFQGITLIEDAYTLWAKLKAEEGTGAFNPELHEEFEDRQGNVMNRKMYTDLARQGLLD